MDLINESKLRALIQEEVQIALSKFISRMNDAIDKIDRKLASSDDYKEFQAYKDQNKYASDLKQMEREQINLTHNNILDRLDRPSLVMSKKRTVDQWLEIFTDLSTDDNRERICAKYNIPPNSLITKLSRFWCRNSPFEHIPPNHPVDQCLKTNTRTGLRGRPRKNRDPVSSQSEIDTSLSIQN